MREFSARERAFLEKKLPGSTTGGTATATSQGRPGRDLSPITRFGSLFGTLIAYTPLVIGSITLIFSALLGYLYLWGRNFFKVSDVERLSSDGTIGLMDETSRGWLQGTLDLFNMAPWLILGTIILGIILMGVSMLLVRKRNG